MKIDLLFQEKNKVFCAIFALKTEEKTGEQRRLQNEDLRDSTLSQKAISVVKKNEIGDICRSHVEDEKWDTLIGKPKS